MKLRLTESASGTKAYPVTDKSTSAWQRGWLQGEVLERQVAGGARSG